MFPSIVRPQTDAKDSDDWLTPVPKPQASSVPPLPIDPLALLGPSAGGPGGTSTSADQKGSDNDLSLMPLAGVSDRLSKIPLKSSIPQGLTGTPSQLGFAGGSSAPGADESGTLKSLHRPKRSSRSQAADPAPTMPSGAAAALEAFGHYGD